MKSMPNTVAAKQLVSELGELMEFQPVTSDHGATLHLLEVVQRKLQDLGLKAAVHSNQGFTYLVAGTKSLRRSKLLLQSHVDVVPAPAAMFKLRQHGDRLVGRGTYDMLFATASYLAILDALHKEKKLGTLDIGVMLSSDEEVGGFHTAKPFTETYDCDVCFLPDAGGNNQLSTSAKGVLHLELTFAGKSGHAGRPLDYKNPIYQLADCAKALHERFPNNDPDATVCSLTTIQGGAALNQVPETAVLTLDLRFVPSDNPASLEQGITTIASQFDGAVRRLVCEPAFSISRTNKFVDRYIHIYEGHTGRHVQEMQAPGSSDARFFSQKDIPVVMIRPEGGGLHGPDEHISLPSLVEFCNILRMYVEDVASDEA